jgi:HAD superfamily hydrolase (TIGR01509 family)
MIKLIVFDLDGVLVDAKGIHFDTLNDALKEVGEEYVISEAEHLSTYDGLKTTQKLEMLTKNKGLDPTLYDDIWYRKQHLTLERIVGITPNETLQSVMSALSEDGYKLAVASNSIKKTVLAVLENLGIRGFMNLIISNEDVRNSKPHPEMYWKVMSRLGVLPEETLIVEDSPYGLLAASRSNAHILRVKNTQELTYTNIFKKITKIEMGNTTDKPKWSDTKMNVLIPMAGAGSRFQQMGYTFPKPLIEVKGQPMIQMVVENLNIDANFIFVVQKEHREKYNLDTLLKLLSPNCKVVEVDGLTEGAACTALLAKEYIDTDAPLFFANSDQFVEWDSNEFFYKMNETDADGGIVTFKATHPKWSFARVNEMGVVVEVAEKNPISNIATVGFYYWKRGSDFVKYAEQMIENNFRINNEFYVCPVFNQAIADGKIIRTYDVPQMWGTGTPEDLKYFEENYKK